MRLAALLLVATVVLGGCGARSNTPFTAKGTVGCLKDKGFTHVSTAPGKVGFIAGFAANGGVEATSPAGNVLTIAFGKDETEVASTEKAFKRAAPRSLQPHMSDVTRSSRNAVMVWTTAPSADDDKLVQGCLAS
jgi:hypothetical protein